MDNEDALKEHSWTSDAMHNLPRHLRFYSKDFFVSFVQRLNANLLTFHSEIVDIERGKRSVQVGYFDRVQHLGGRNVKYVYTNGCLFGGKQLGEEHQHHLYLSEARTPSYSAIFIPSYLILKVQRYTSVTLIKQRTSSNHQVVVQEKSSTWGRLMDDLNVTIEEYIRLEEEKAQKRGKVFNWETTKYGKIWYNEDIHDLRYQGLDYTDADIADFEERLERIHDRDTHRVQVVDFQVFTSQAWRRLFDIRGPLVGELILEFLSTLKFGELLLDLDAPGTIQFQLGRARRCMSWRQFIVALGLHTGEEMESLGFARYWSESGRMIPGKGDLRDYWRSIYIDGDFLGPPPSYTLIRDPVLRLFHRMMAHSIAGRSQAPEKICEEIDDTWAWVALGPERQPDAADGAPGAAEDAPVVDEGDQTILAPGLRQDVRTLRGLVERLMTNQGRFSTWMTSCMTQLMEASGQTYQAFDGTFRGSSPAAF
ncbi:hypothetical protein Tco_0889784 [Tanacetum coccineum]